MFPKQNDWNLSTLPINHIAVIELVELGFKDMSILVSHFVSSPREREKTARRDSRGHERE